MSGIMQRVTSAALQELWVLIRWPVTSANLQKGHTLFCHLNKLQGLWPIEPCLKARCRVFSEET
jgi:hypothetical protein